MFRRLTVRAGAAAVLPGDLLRSPEEERTLADPADPTATTVAGVRLTHPGRVLYRQGGITKGEVARYYVAVAERILPHLVGRPLAVVRCPRGEGEPCFYQQHRTGSLPAAVHGVEVEERQGRATHLVIHDLAGLVSLVQVGALEFHPWGCREDRPERPDRLIFDLDPSPEVGWEAVREAARQVAARLAAAGLESFLRTSGGKGLHVVVPLARHSGWEEVKACAYAVAAAMAAAEPERYLATAAKDERRGRIFIDWLRNARGATAVASYSTRARPGAPVATPLAWDELAGLESAAAYTVANLGQRLGGLARDPWEGFFDLRQRLTRAVRRRLGAG
jgi:bifunctional non-homologous end joining protein LigD